jgi:hypothetical protein
MVQIFSAYHRQRTITSRSALLIIHPDARFVAKIQPDWHQAASRLCDIAAEKSNPIILSIPSGTSPMAQLHSKRYVHTCPRPCESAFFFSDLYAVLTRLGVDGLIICGAPTSGAVRATAVEAKSFGFKAAIAEESTGDEAALLHKIALFDIAHKYADVMSLEELVTFLEDFRGA